MGPTQPTVIFDGVCNLCNGAVSFLVARDRERHLRYTSNDSDTAQAILAHVGVAPETISDTIFLYDQGVLYQRSDAVFRLLGYLPWPWRAAAFGRVLPRPLRDAAYRLVAANRYRVFGRSDTCRLPTASERELFI